MDNILKKVHKAPKLPGVYIFLDKNENIIYVGKAVSLINRLRSYFDSSVKSPKTLKMLELVADLKYIVTNTETEALLLEASLIKTEKPRFNVKLKDAKGYPYIKLTKDDYPRIIITRNTKDDAVYYGPYVNVNELRAIVKDLHQIFPLRRCKNTKFRERMVCIYYQMKQCEGPCENHIDKKEYDKIVNDIKLFFKGDVKVLEEKYLLLMKNYADSLEFEKAAKYRDRLKALKEIFVKKQSVADIRGNLDIFYFDNSLMFSVTKMFIRNSNITGVETEVFDNDELYSQSEIVLSFYKNTSQVPENISLINYNDYFDDKYLLEAISNLGNKKVIFKNKLPSGLIDILYKNSQMAVSQYLESKKGFDRIKAKFDKYFSGVRVKTVECIDISHIFGSFTVGASICYDLELEKFVKEKYRRYRLEKVTNNDYESIYQVVSRKIDRIKGGQELKSDLYIIDGGLGQLNAAMKACRDKSFQLNLISIAKGRSKDFDEKLESSLSPEYIYLPNRKNPMNLKKNDPFLLFIQKIRDESHRFVINYSRSIALKNIKKSKLVNIKGVGEKRAKKLLMAYPDLRDILNKSDIDISKDTGIPINIISVIKEKLTEDLYN